MLKIFSFVLSMLLSISCQSYPIKKIILTEKNTITFRGEVTNYTSAKFQADILKLSKELTDKDVIYVFINSPGGSISAGRDILNTFKIIPQKIHTITHSAASMAFMISQEGEIRYILESGYMMGHRASGGFQGQFNVGEIESRLKFWTDLVTSMEQKVADRMGLSLKEYQAMIKDELWMYGKDAINKNAADKIADVECSKELLDKEVDDKVEMQIGPFVVLKDAVFSGCPMIVSPLRVKE